MNRKNLEVISSVAQVIFCNDYLWFVSDANSVETTIDDGISAHVTIDEDILLVSIHPPGDRYTNQWREKEFDMGDPNSIQHAQEEVHYWLNEMGVH